MPFLRLELASSFPDAVDEAPPLPCVLEGGAGVAAVLGGAGAGVEQRRGGAGRTAWKGKQERGYQACYHNMKVSKYLPCEYGMALSCG